MQPTPRQLLRRHRHILLRAHILLIHQTIALKLGIQRRLELLRLEPRLLAPPRKENRSRNNRNNRNDAYDNACDGAARERRTRRAAAGEGVREFGRDARAGRAGLGRCRGGGLGGRGVAGCGGGRGGGRGRGRGDEVGDLVADRDAVGVEAAVDGGRECECGAGGDSVECGCEERGECVAQRADFG
jgi:hypothetical protein